MLLMVGVENPKDDNYAWGIEVPAFERIGLGCTSAADEEGDIKNQARDAILSMAKVALDKGIKLAELEDSFNDYSNDENYKHCSRWFALDVNLES